VRKKLTSPPTISCDISGSPVIYYYGSSYSPLCFKGFSLNESVLSESSYCITLFRDIKLQQTSNNIHQWTVHHNKKSFKVQEVVTAPFSMTRNALFLGLKWSWSGHLFLSEGLKIVFWMCKVQVLTYLTCLLMIEPRWLLPTCGLVSSKQVCFQRLPVVKIFLNPASASEIYIITVFCSHAAFRE
jgi:hypothetical protein